MTVPDFFPILKYLEHTQKKARTSSSLYSTSGDYPAGDGPIPGSHDSQYRNQTLSVVPEVNIEDSSEVLHHHQRVEPRDFGSGSHDSQGGSHDFQARSHDSGVTEGSEGIFSSCVGRVVDIDKIDEEVKKLAVKCRDRCRLLSCDVRTSPRTTTNSFSNWTTPSEDGSLLSSDGIQSRLGSFDKRRRTPSDDM